MTLVKQIRFAVPAAAAIGAAAWGGNLALLGLAPVAVALWASRTRRTAAWLVMLAYYLAVARGLPIGAAKFFGGDWAALFAASLWLGASLALSLPWALLWSAQRTGYYWRVPVAVILCVIPPIGLVGWGNPVLAAGVFFPAMGWCGVIVMALALVAVAYAPWRTGLALAACGLAGLVFTATPAAPEWIEARNTNYGGAGDGGRDFMRDFAANQQMIAIAMQSKAPYMLFPETVAGLWTDATADLWADAAEELKRTGRTVLVGAEIPIDGTNTTRNSLVYVGAEQGELQQRIPVPVSMWRPWADSGTVADVMGHGLGQLNGLRAAVFVCYEQLLAWPALLSMAAQPQLLVGAANDYWAADTSIPHIQNMTLRAWSRAFSVPVVQAVNF
jgi:hypothetical protein